MYRTWVANERSSPGLFLVRRKPGALGSGSEVRGGQQGAGYLAPELITESPGQGAAESPASLLKAV